ncbi:penicillin-binding protein [Herbiconiux sp. YIM B11900]|uniref:penicillin-binding protein n=1 Tax=Herbiconiux sp. YIM B11900 TaxID=3404131 RepID=UPI003F870E89
MPALPRPHAVADQKDEMPSSHHDQRRTPISIAAACLGLISLSAVAGVLVAAMITPTLAVAGVAANSSIDMFEGLPEYIRPDKLAQKTDIYATDAAGNPVLLASVFDQNREEVGWDQISQFAKDAVIATEDPRFYNHGGVDIASSLRAAIGNTASGEVESGASTISMQYVKNIFVQRAEALPDEAERKRAYEEATQGSIDRKLKEMKLAIGLEKEFSKSDILLGYLNIASFGGTVYGIQAAARYYYGVNATDLTLAQAASLIAIVNEPNGLRIDYSENIPANQARRDMDVLPAMLKEKRITQAQYDEAIATPVTPTITQPSTGCQTANTIGAGFFCDYVGRIIGIQNVLGQDANGEANSLARGGYDIYTTLDVELQGAAVNAMDGNVPKSSELLDLGASLVTVEPGTGRVLAMVQNKFYNADPAAAAPDNTALNYATDYEYGGSTGFQVGSTYKVFTLAEWLEQGRSLNDRVNGNQRPFNLASFQDSCLGAGTGTYAPRNDGGSNPGTMTVLAATSSSTNNAFMQMAQALDQCEIRKTAEAFGVHRADGETLTSYPSDVLGTNEIAPLSMAAAFAAIANQGVFCSPIAIDRIIDSEGTEIPVPPSSCTPAVSPQVANTMAYALTSVVTSGTATASNPQNGIPHFGKTGTTDSEKDTWFVGATTELATAVWVGNINGTVSLRNSTIAGQNGGSIRHSIWRTFMSDADGKYGGGAFAAPEQTLVQGVPVSVPNVVGLSVGAAQTAIEAAGFEFEQGASTDSAEPAGTVLTTSPSGSATRGATITVTTSNGTPPPTPTRTPPPQPTSTAIPAAPRT